MDTIPITITKKLVAFGSNPVYLPKFTVALVRTPGLSPYYARFKVPLNFSKFDLRDYLFHAYEVRCYNIRSFVKQQPVRDTRLQPHHWFRPESLKYMTVEMEKPFVWPADPEDWEPWGKKEFEQQRQDALKMGGVKERAEEQRAAMLKLKEQAKAVLEGRPAVKDEPKETEDADEKAATKSKPGKRRTLLEEWEANRTIKVVESDDQSQYRVRV
ncbi:mitochondrial ribosomal protein subunit L23 [Massariosphaeria phaeospora]|uniref:Large ribosomal subunit protein uL23m n=1 Tax=Massariosphaeria phaeospora TaxID=100035 RepID=A0A7C8I8B8_9PLEO|nr:mitochondrial ribosomal protein subunit L23 [Massariosphaeria phaeospora]